MKTIINYNRLSLLAAVAIISCFIFTAPYFANNSPDNTSSSREIESAGGTEIITDDRKAIRRNDAITYPYYTVAFLTVVTFNRQARFL